MTETMEQMVALEREFGYRPPHDYGMSKDAVMMNVATAIATELFRKTGTRKGIVIIDQVALEENVSFQLKRLIENHKTHQQLLLDSLRRMDGLLADGQSPNESAQEGQGTKIDESNK